MWRALLVKLSLGLQDSQCVECITSYVEFRTAGFSVCGEHY